MTPAKFCPSLTGSMIVKLTLPEGDVARRRKMMLFSAAITASLPDRVVSKRTEPSYGYFSNSGSEIIAGPGKVKRESWGRVSANFFRSTSRRANFTAFFVAAGGVQFSHNEGRHMEKSFSAATLASRIAS